MTAEKAQQAASRSGKSDGALRLGHVAIVVPSLPLAMERWQAVLQRPPSPCQTLEEHGVRVVFFDLDNTRIELLEPFGDKSKLASFLAKHPRGGIHHICFETQTLETLYARMRKQGLPFALDARIARGAHDNPVFFLHPQALDGALVEFEGILQAPASEQKSSKQA